MIRQPYIFSNTTDEPVWLQIEYWADLLYLLPLEMLTLVIYVEELQEDNFQLETAEDGDNILYINNSSEYFIVEGENEIHHHDYGSNVIGWSSNICKESSLKGFIIHPSLVNNGS